MSSQLIKKYKWCPRCRKCLPMDSFHKNKSTISGVNSFCAKCMGVWQREKYKTNKREIRRKAKVYYHTVYKKTFSEDDKRNAHFRKNYGISLVDYLAMVDTQKGFCGICGKDPTQNKSALQRHKKLHIDHCHRTGKIRGLLCNSCNNALGVFGDNVSGLRRAIKYLTRKAV